MNKKHIILFASTALLLSSCNVYRCRPMLHTEMEVSQNATTQTNELAKPVETPQSSIEAVAQNAEAKPTVATDISSEITATTKTPTYQSKALPKVKMSTVKAIRTLKKLRNIKPNDASEFFSDKNVLIMALASILAALSSFACLFLFASILPALIAFLVWLILMTMVKMAMRNEYDDYEPITKAMAIISMGIYGVLFILWYVIEVL